ncbi:MAG: response regulator [Oscillospiraceae bacterium]|jgi:two-component system response regulator (stage 0 sporulation protein A)|nr:response regulator [Oscillospiraceae bacterium]
MDTNNQYINENFTTNKVTVIIADTNEAFREVLADSLTANSEIVVPGTYAGGSDAFFAVLKYNPDVLLTDLILQGTDGISLVEKIFELPVSLRPRVVVMSAFFSAYAREKLSHLGITRAINKPCDVSEILSAILYESADGPSAETKEAYEIEYTITETLRDIGIPAHLAGFSYIREAVVQLLLHPGYIANVTRSVYPAVAKKLVTTQSRVERAIRNAIEIAWERGNSLSLAKIFGDQLPAGGERPPNALFLSALARSVSNISAPPYSSAQLGYNRKPGDHGQRRYGVM